MYEEPPRQRLAKLLESVIEERMHPMNAMKEVERWNDLPWESHDVSVAVHALARFHLDGDLRQKYPEYDEDLKHNLRLLVSNLRYN